MPAEFPAVTLSGSASASARIVLSTTRCIWQKREKQARGKVGLKIVPFGRDHLHRPEDAVVLRHVLGERASSSRIVRIA